MGLIRECLECGAVFRAKRTSAQFCSAKCGTKFNNRRKERGAQLYDLWMINRHERDLAKDEKVLHLMTRLAMYWKEEDDAQRDGRRSYQKKPAIERVQWARATVVSR